MRVHLIERRRHFANDTKIGKLCLASRVDKNVGRLNITARLSVCQYFDARTRNLSHTPMQHMELLMYVCEPVKQLHSNLAQLRLRDGPRCRQQLLQRATIHQLEQCVNGALAVKGVEQRNNRRMMALPQRPQLQHLLIGNECVPANVRAFVRTCFLRTASSCCSCCTFMA